MGITITPDQNGLTIRGAEPTDMYGNMHDGQVTVDCSGIVDNHPIKVKAGCTIKHIELEMSVPRKFPISLRSDIAPNSVINIENCNFIDNLGGNFPGGMGETPRGNSIFNTDSMGAFSRDLHRMS